MVSPSLAGQSGLPLPIFESMEAALRAAAEILVPAKRWALLFEDGAALAPLKP